MNNGRNLSGRHLRGIQTTTEEDTSLQQFGTLQPGRRNDHSSNNFCCFKQANRWRRELVSTGVDEEEKVWEWDQ